ncbi:TPA: hypothetical protein HH295_21360 [Xanthomonas vasicola pv. zeae]|uniref:Uncharacterized protein n=1 Tax=Xanthomonas vasicola TaxID=56459 RepID=A0ABD7S3P6_XANVA|nr:hypothetical protein [Xanthomonas vasicola]MBV6748622.1 hypothetical protein [Xanthomonas vasicola pv. vasculorum NCPPB 890]MBV6894289.1 hypothetical protein [Xanthomonas vasicola pv. vasculorum]MDO6950179.1 hypothetical protein [Xanthomonas vasicola]MDO6954093.1 hypothetical protein [Xanthomonas vasicola]MDO6958024.1 hypothetical protein [Xanthomonas vasicola]
MRKLYFFIILIIFQSFLTSCKFEVDKELKGKGAAQNEPSARIESLDRKAQDSSPDLNPSTSIDGLKEGMVYGQLRRIVISSGWRPKVNPDCKKNVVGRDFDKICSSNPSLCKECDSLPELSECSADGHCLSEFISKDGNKLLKVATYGEIGDAAIEEKQSGLPVSWWNVEDIAK